MIIQSHNSWSYLKPKKWWMKLLAFTARCQAYDIYDQYYLYDVKAFDLRIRFDNDGNIIIAHGLIEYDYTQEKLMEDLDFLNKIKGITVRVLHEVRNEKQYTNQSVFFYINFCRHLREKFKNIEFYGGYNLFNNKQECPSLMSDIPTESKYSSVCPPKIFDDWYPWLYARIHNKRNIKKGTNKKFLAIDFVNIGR